MKAAVLNRLNGIFDLEDIAIDVPIGREVRVIVKAVGLCHSDLHFAEEEFGIPLPAVLGHEFAGIVESVGPDAREFSIGDHVVGSLIQFCGHCVPCAAGHSYQCDLPDETLRSSQDRPRLRRAGLPLTQVFGTGAFAEKALVHEHQLVRVPDNLPFAQASLLGCGTITGAGAVLNTARVKSGDSIAVIGVGGVGLNVISGALLSDAGRIIAIDVHAQKGLMARRFGATDFINANDCDPVAALRELVPRGVDHVFEVVGRKATSQQALKMARKGGGVYFIGVQNPASTIDVNVTLDLLMNQLEVRGVYMGSSNIKTDIPKYAELYLQRRLNLDDLVSREIDLSQINDAYKELKSGLIARSIVTSFA